MSNYTYIVKNKINGKFYIGSHTWKGEGLDPNYYGSGTAITRAVKKYGKDNFTVEALHYYDTVEDCRTDEEKILNKYDISNNFNSYNCKNSSIGFKSDEVKKMWAKKEYRNKVLDSINKKVKTYEYKEKLSKLKKEYWKDINNRKKQSEKMIGINNPMYGKQLSKEVRKKMSKNKWGKPFIAINNNTNKIYIFYSQRQCSRYLNLNIGSVNKCLNGKRKSTKGYTFKIIKRDKIFI